MATDRLYRVAMSDLHTWPTNYTALKVNTANPQHSDGGDNLVGDGSSGFGQTKDLASGIFYSDPSIPNVRLLYRANSLEFEDFMHSTWSPEARVQDSTIAFDPAGALIAGGGATGPVITGPAGFAQPFADAGAKGAVLKMSGTENGVNDGYRAILDVTPNQIDLDPRYDALALEAAGASVDLNAGRILKLGPMEDERIVGFIFHKTREGVWVLVPANASQMQIALTGQGFIQVSFNYTGGKWEEVYAAPWADTADNDHEFNPAMAANEQVRFCKVDGVELVNHGLVSASLDLNWNTSSEDGDAGAVSRTAIDANDATCSGSLDVWERDNVRRQLTALGLARRNTRFDLGAGDENGNEMFFSAPSIRIPPRALGSNDNQRNRSSFPFNARMSAPDVPMLILQELAA